MYQMSQKVQKLAFFNEHVQRDNWYEGKICAKYGGASFTYGFFTPNTRKLFWIFCLKFYILLFFRGIGLSKLFFDL